MTRFSEHPAQLDLTAPARLAETPFGFAAHQLYLKPDERVQHYHVMRTALGDPAVRTVLSEFDAYRDEATKLHSKRVGSIAVGAAIRYGLTAREQLMVARGSLGHDVGKADDAMQEVITTTKKVEDNPGMYDVICDHPITGGVIVDSYGYGPNERRIVEEHHAFQTRRPAYGTGRPIVSLPESDGFTPNTLAMAQLLAGSDNIDSLTVSPALSGRNYLRGGSLVPERAVQAVGSLAIPDDIKQATLEVVGYN